MWSRDLQEVWNWSGDSHGRSEVVSRPSRRSGSGRETLSKIRNWSGDTPGGPEVVGRPSRKS